MKACLMHLTATLLALCVVTQAARAACSIGAQPLAFGHVNPLAAKPADSLGRITVSCSGTPGSTMRYRISLGPGIAGGFSARQLRQESGAKLLYNLYLDPARVVVWGDGSVGTEVLTDSYTLTGPSATRGYPVYGRIPGSQNVPPGSYRDAVLVSFDF